MRLIFLLTVCIILVGVVHSGVVTQSFGTPDEFNDNPNAREYVPQRPKLANCKTFNWLGVNRYTGDKKPMLEPWFDKNANDSALVWSVGNLPNNLQNPRFEMTIRGTGINCNNDGFGFFWDEAIPTNWRWGKRWGDWDEGSGECKAQYFKTFTSIPQLEDYQVGLTVNMTVGLGTATIYGTGTTLVDKIKKEGYFNFFVGDDSTVDYFRFIYDTPYEEQEVVSFSCKPVEAGMSSIAIGQRCHTDSDKTISEIVDSTVKPFSGALSVKTYGGDRTRTDSTFKMKVEKPTRMWVFVPEADVNSNSWLVDAGYARLNDGYIKTNDNTKYIPFTKNYDGDRWITCGRPSKVGATAASKMYFAAFAPATAVIQAPSNPAASCDCESTGDPHFVTWDNRKFDFYEEGAFHLIKARDCSFDVQAYSYKYGSKVTVNGILGVRHLGNIITLSRQKEPAGKIWSGNPVIRVNGATTTDGIIEIGGLKATKVSSVEWKIELKEVGLSIRAVVSGSWFHIYMSLSSVDYQKRVDGLCGNCDGNGKNDFKYPSCENAINITSTALDYTQTARWGSSWKVSDGQLFANFESLSETGLGASTYSSCTANPIKQQCDDLIPPEVTGGVPVSEPLPPSNFYTCDGDKVVPVKEEPLPPVPPTIEEPPTVCDGDKLTKIVNKCTYCATQTHYDPEDCITDLCESGEDVNEYHCPGENKCVASLEPDTTITEGTYQWAILDGSDVEGIAEEDFCDTVHYLPPPGWEVVPEVTDAAKKVISEHGMSAHCIALGQTSFPTKSTKTQDGTCPTTGSIVKTTNGCYIANNCNTKIMIRRPIVPECGNGILEGNEGCDDGNKVSLDGCSSTCTVESTHFCITTITPNLCSSVSNVVEEEEHECPIQNKNCHGCTVTDENRNEEFCCECALPCCD